MSAKPPVTNMVAQAFLCSCSPSADAKKAFGFFCAAHRGFGCSTSSDHRKRIVVPVRYPVLIIHPQCMSECSLKENGPFQMAEPPSVKQQANFRRLQFGSLSQPMFTNIRDRNRLPITEVPATTSFPPSFSFQRVPCAQERDNGTGRASVGHISQALHFLASSILLTSQGEWGRLICSCLTLNVIYTCRAGCVNFHCEPDPPDQIIQSHLH